VPPAELAAPRPTFSFEPTSPVWAVDRDAHGLAELGSAGAVTGVADITSADDCDALSGQQGALAGLVNCAGVLTAEPMGHVTREAWRRMFAVNLEAAFFLTQAMLDRFLPGSAIVNVASTAAKTGTTTELAAYAATKAGLLSVTRSLSAHLASKGVRVNAICPGIIDTPMQDSLLHELERLGPSPSSTIDEDRIATVPLGRPASANECAEVIAFLLSPKASYMTGQAINVSVAS
jgi:NAD(P)-dependent dehydrogenase (short-subunit alcohol dehydrogenase family)